MPDNSNTQEHQFRIYFNQAINGFYENLAQEQYLARLYNNIQYTTSPTEEPQVNVIHTED